MRVVALGLLVASVANAECPNSCSGHGTCGKDDICTCFQNWQNGDEASGDCSDRTCQFDISWSDVPSASNTAHFYQECSGRGTCDRKTGECDCFDGFTGSACKRSVCPNDCSGHGTCEFISDVFPSDANGVEIHLTHDLLGKVWDSDKSRKCVCDAKWTDVDCSRKMCPKGNDPLDDCSHGYADPAMQVQTICFKDILGGEFAIKYNDYYGGSYTTSTLNYDAAAEDIVDALLSLADHAVDAVDVNVLTATETQCSDLGGWDSGTIAGWTVTFEGHQVTGKQHVLELMTQQCRSGCQPRVEGLLPASAGLGATSVIISTTSESDMFECSRRGKCDYDSGVCECFDGFTDEDCSVQSSLA